MPLAQVTAGLQCTGETVVQGTSISSFNVQVINVLNAPGEGPRILIRASGPAVDSTGIAAGFSGSPVYCPDSTGTPANAGAISEGVGDYGNHLALVTPIEQMLGEPVTPPSHMTRLTARTRQLAGPLNVAGLSAGMLNVLEQAASRAGRTVLPAPGDPLGTFPVQPLVPGASVGISYSTGMVGIGAVGTVTYRTAQTVYAFGHPLDEIGRRSLPLQDAFVYDVIGNPLLGSVKLAAPGHIEGTLTSDTPNAVIGQVGAGPTMIPVQVNATDLDTGHAIQEQTQVADETDVGSPMGGSLLGLVAPLAVGQAATDVYNGPPANESGRMCLRITIRELRKPLGFCKRYVGTGLVSGGGGPALPELTTAAASDVSSALTLLDSEQFARLHVTSLLVTIAAQRGLAEATLLSAKAPKRVKAGSTVHVHLIARRYRGPLRRIVIKLRIPRHTHGLLPVSIHSPSAPPAGANALASQLSVVLIGAPGPSAPSRPPPATVPALRQEFAAIASYDGLQATFGGASGKHPPSGPTERVYRNPALLINGEADLTFSVH